MSLWPLAEAATQTATAGHVISGKVRGDGDVVTARYVRACVCVRAPRRKELSLSADSDKCAGLTRPSGCRQCCLVAQPCRSVCLAPRGGHTRFHSARVLAFG